MKICIISDTHDYIEPLFEKHFAECDEIWHAGDIGSIDIINRLKTINSNIKAVFGNIDGNDLRKIFPEYALFYCDNVSILLIHNGGTPQKYPENVKSLIIENKPNILVCGHTDILKVQFDHKYNLLYINPGAAGNFGIHRMKTIIKIDINNSKPENLQVVEVEK